MTIFPHSMMGTYTVHFGNKLEVVRKDAGACGETSMRLSSPCEPSTELGTIWPVIMVQNPFLTFLARLRFRLDFATDGDDCGFDAAPRSFLRTILVTASLFSAVLSAVLGCEATVADVVTSPAYHP